MVFWQPLFCAAAFCGVVLSCTGFSSQALVPPTSLGHLRGRGAPTATASQRLAALEGAFSSAACLGSISAVVSGCLAAAAGLARGARRPRPVQRTVRAARAAGAAEPEEEAPPPPFDPSTQDGAMAPLGFFDPLGYSKIGDEEGFRKLRVAELKHGRVAMMASAGLLIQHSWKFPGFGEVPSGVGAVVTPPGTYGFAALFLLSGVLELFVWTQDPKKPVGDFGDPAKVGWLIPTESGNVGSPDFRNRELNNGRFAMFAVLGEIVAELATGKDAVQQLGL